MSQIRRLRLCKRQSKYRKSRRKTDNDIKFYSTDGQIVKGHEALVRMPSIDLVHGWPAISFFAMNDVIAAFRKNNAGTSVGLITLPPSLQLRAIKAGDWVLDDKEYRGLPDIYASVNRAHLKDLKENGLMYSYMIYMHDELQIMVTKGNPKKIASIKDLDREGVRTSMPNPVNEGIVQFYARKVLERRGFSLRDALSEDRVRVSSEGQVPSTLSMLS